ncbi:MAG TPA: response regulator [Verrucomicrobiae bacterium]|nr:response regulator [Verrucomicrobiae bacterium]
MGKKRILVIDDDIHATRMLKVGLEKGGPFEVREVNRGVEALRVAQEFRPDAVLLDVCIPDVEGSEIAFQIANQAGLRTTPIVFLTSIVSERELAEKQGIIGGHRYIAKPTRLEKVIAYLENELGLCAQDDRSTAVPTGGLSA